MFDPKYKINSQVINNLNDIERLYGKLEGMKVPSNLLLNLQSNNMVQSAYSSNSIEGNPLSHAEVTNLILDGRIPVNRDEKEVKNYYDILRSFDDKPKEDFTLDFILKTHRSLLTGVKDEIAGKIRNSEVVVGYRDFSDGNLVVKHNPPFHKQEQIRGALLELVDWVNEESDIPVMLKAGILHHQFVFIHPFVDGNGRVCRLSTAYFLLENNYKINKYFVLDDYYDVDRDQYSDKLHSADTGNKTEWLEYFTGGVKYSLQSALSKAERGLDKMEISLRLTSREKETLRILQQYNEIKTADLAKELDVSRQQAFNLLQGLVEKGYAETLGQGKGSYYKLV